MKLPTCSFGVGEGSKWVIFQAEKQFSKDRSHQREEMHLSITTMKCDLLWENTEVCCDPLVKIITIPPGLCTSRAPWWQGEGLQALI